MVIRLGRYGEFLACSMYPEHKETRELPGVGGSGTTSAAGGEGAPTEPAASEVCPKCGTTDGGVLVQRRGRFGPFMGCSRYPDCDYIKKEGPPPPAPLAFEVTCPDCKKGHLTTRRARRTGSLFWGCSRYPNCSYTTSHEPIGANHDVDKGPVGRNGDAGLCLVCGAAVDLTGIDDPVGRSLAGGEANPAALARPSASRSRRTGRPAATSGARKTTASRSGGRKPVAGAKHAAADSEI
jgi:ssDNA-binding Zn-finger/Zn-ribbon topoisomerase 1